MLRCEFCSMVSSLPSVSFVSPSASCCSRGWCCFCVVSRLPPSPASPVCYPVSGFLVCCSMLVYHFGAHLFWALSAVFWSQRIAVRRFLVLFSSGVSQVFGLLASVSRAPKLGINATPIFFSVAMVLFFSISPSSTSRTDAPLKSSPRIAQLGKPFLNVCWMRPSCPRQTFLK